ncbi:hypothetical protein ABIE33_002655 [Ensifer sp. 4252]
MSPKLFSANCRGVNVNPTQRGSAEFLQRLVVCSGGVADELREGLIAKICRLPRVARCADSETAAVENWLLDNAQWRRYPYVFIC